MRPYEYDNMLRVISLVTILLAAPLPCFSSEAKVQPKTFGASGISLEGVQKITIYELGLMDTARSTNVTLRKHAAATLIIQCGASCSQTIPKIIAPLIKATETDQCLRRDKSIIIDFDDAYSIEFYLGGGVFRFRDKCFVSEEAVSVLMDIFDFY